MKTNKLYYIAGIVIGTVSIFIIMHFVIHLPAQQILCGTPAIESFLSNDINYLEIVQWIWIYFPLWVIGGYYIENYMQMKHLCILRYKSIPAWLSVLYRHCSIYLFSYFLTLLALNFLFLRQFLFWPAILITVHAFLGECFFILCRCLSDSGVYAIGLLLAIEFMGLFADLRWQIPTYLNPPVWGMYMRCNTYTEQNTFNVFIVIFLEFMIGTLFLLAGIKILHRKRG